MTGIKVHIEQLFPPTERLILKARVEFLDVLGKIYIYPVIFLILLEQQSAEHFLLNRVYLYYLFSDDIVPLAGQCDVKIHQIIKTWLGIYNNY